jgi:serine/threonine protein kinase
MKLQTSVNINDYAYADNLISSDKEARTYKAVHLFNPDMPPLTFKGYPESFLEDPLKEKKMMQELNILHQLRGKPHVIQLLSQHYRDRMVFIISEYCEEGDLQSQMQREGPFPEAKAVDYIRQIVEGYKAIHELRIVHRQLEPSNILSTNNHILKIGEFSQAIYEKEAQLVMHKEELVGTHAYQAPEVLENYQYSTQSDIYSLGLIFLSMLRGTKVYSG